MRLEELRVAGIKALAKLEPGFLEVRGELVLRQRRRLSDYANHPDSMLELDGASVRAHRDGQAEEWEEVEQLSLNRNRLVVIIPVEEEPLTANPRLMVPCRPVRVKMICSTIQVTGFISLPIQMTVPSFIYGNRGRFLAVTQARIMPGPGEPELADFAALHQFCLVNRDHLAACIETRSGRES